MSKYKKVIGSFIITAALAAVFGLALPGKESSFGVPHTDQRVDHGAERVAKINDLIQNEHGNILGSAMEEPTLTVEEEEYVSEEPKKPNNVPQEEISIVEQTESVPEETNETLLSFDHPLTDDECSVLSTDSYFYWNPKSQVVTLEEKLRREGDIKDADLLREISCRPQAAWLTRPDKDEMRKLAKELTLVAEAVGQVPVLVLYNAAQGNSILWRFGNQGQDYIDWMEAVADGIGDRKAWVILEPDALGMSGSYNETDRAYRHDELKKAVRILKSNAPNARVYIDAANSGWWSGEYIAKLLDDVDVNLADGFALNVANYHYLENEIARAEEASEILGGNIHFVIDTGRNGNGSAGGWCNLPGKALGALPTRETGNHRADAFLWIKPPGESDGECNGGPPAGKFWLTYALELVENAL